MTDYIEDKICKEVVNIKWGLKDGALIQNGSYPDKKGDTGMYMNRGKATGRQCEEVDIFKPRREASEGNNPVNNWI